MAGQWLTADEQRAWRAYLRAGTLLRARLNRQLQADSGLSLPEYEVLVQLSEALLWAIDLHNRTAHLGLSLRPACRGRGLGTDVVVALCEYGFAIRGLHRLQVDTLASNTAMIRAASRAGFVREGTLRRAAWVNGEFADEVILGMLATDWSLSSGPRVVRL